MTWRSETERDPLYILDSPILTSYGLYEYRPISIEEAREIVRRRSREIISAVGHKATADLLSRLFGFEIEVCRKKIEMEAGDQALVFQVLERLPEGTELQRIPYRLGILTRED